MIELNVQIKLIVFSFIFGFFFSIMLEIFNKKIFNYKNYIKFILSIVFISIFSYIYFNGIQKIGFGIFHIYSIISIVMGFIFYDLIIMSIANNSKK